MSEREQKTYVEFLFRGSLVDESTKQEVTNRSVLLDVPEGAFAFHFFDVYVTRMHDGFTNREVHSKRFNESPMYYPGGQAFTLEQVQALGDKSHSILVSNMECNGYKTVVRTRWGNWKPFKAGDVVLPTP